MITQFFTVVLCYCTFCVVSVNCEKQIERRALADYSEFVLKPNYEEERVITKQTTFTQPIEVATPVPVKIELPAQRPFIVYVPRLYPVYFEKKVPYPVEVPLSHVYTVENLVPLQLKVPSENLNPTNVYKTLPMLLETKVPHKVQQFVSSPVKVPEEYSYSAKVTVLKPDPYLSEKSARYPVNVPFVHSALVPFHKPIAVPAANPLLYPYDRSVPYSLENPIEQLEIKYPKTDVSLRNKTDKEGLFIHVQNLHKYAQLNKFSESVEEENNQQNYVSPVKSAKSKSEENIQEQSEKDDQKETYRESRSNENVEKNNVHSNCEDSNIKFDTGN